MDDIGGLPQPSDCPHLNGKCPGELEEDEDEGEVFA